MAIVQLFCSAGPPRKRDSLYSWMVCVCATMTWVASLGLLFSFSVFLPVFMDYFKASRETAAWVGSLAIALAFFTGHLSTALIIWFGCRVTTLIGGAFCVVSLITSSLVENISVLFFTYSLLFGLGCSCTFSSGLVVIGQFFKKRQSIATGVLQAGIGGGMLILGPTLEALIRAHGWQTCLRIMAIAAFVLCSLAITFDPNVETDNKNSAKEKEEEAAESRVKKKGETIVTKIKTVFDLSVWKEPAFIAFIICDFLTESGFFVPQIHLVRYCEELGLSSERASQLLIYYGLCSMIARLLAGILCSHPRVRPLIVFQAAAFVSGLNTIIVTLARTYTPLVIYAIIYGFCDGFFYCCLGLLLLTVNPPKAAAVIGWKMMLVSFAQASGPALAGLMADKLGSYVVPFRVAGGITLSGALIPFLFLCCSRRDRTNLMLEEEEEGQSLLNHSS